MIDYWLLLFLRTRTRHTGASGSTVLDIRDGRVVPPNRWTLRPIFWNLPSVWFCRRARRTCSRRFRSRRWSRRAPPRTRSESIGTAWRDRRRPFGVCWCRRTRKCTALRSVSYLSPAAVGRTAEPLSIDSLFHRIRDTHTVVCVPTRPPSTYRAAVVLLPLIDHPSSHTDGPILLCLVRVILFGQNFPTPIYRFTI